MRYIFLILALHLAASASSDAAERRRVQFLSKPINLSKQDAYKKFLMRKLLITPATHGSMILSPAFEGEFAVAVYSLPVVSPREARRYRVTFTEAASNIYYALIPKGAYSLNSSRGLDQERGKQIQISRVDVNIDPELAALIQQTWRVMLSREPIPELGGDWDRYVATDGYGAEFSVMMPDGQTVARETTNPHFGPATDMVDAGLALANYCKASASGRPRERKLLLNGLRRVIRVIEKA
jgi:hypothetical protein